MLAKVCKLQHILISLTLNPIVIQAGRYIKYMNISCRNFGQSESSSVKFEMIATDPSKGNPPNQFKMTAGSHSVVVTASNKREGKQLASQLLLSVRIHTTSHISFNFINRHLILVVFNLIHSKFIRI